MGELQTGSVDRPQAPQVATAANSTTLAVQLASQKRWKVAARIAALMSALGFAAAAVPAAFIPGLVVGGLGGVLSVVFAAQSGAEIDEKALEAVADRVTAILDRKRPPQP